MNELAQFKFPSSTTAVFYYAATGLTLNTVKVARKIGCTENSTGNLRHVLKTLGIDFDRLSDLHGEVSTWADSTLESYRSELETRGVLQTS